MWCFQERLHLYCLFIGPMHAVLSRESLLYRILAVEFSGAIVSSIERVHFVEFFIQ